MRRMFSCSSSQVAVESWSKQDQKLLEAVERGDVGRVAALAARKAARPAKLNAAGQSAFHLAASRGLTECLTLLLAHGAPVNERNDDGSTALHLATIACQPQCVKVLLQYGANEDHVDAQNRTPLHWAASSGCASSVLLLCDHEALLDVTDAQGQTPLMLAARGNHAAICAQLLQRGADPRLGDKDNKTALALAREHGSRDSAELLLRHGAAAGDTDPGHRAGGSAASGPGAAQGEETPDSEEEEEEEQDEEQRVRRLRERLARKSRQCRRLARAAGAIRQRVRELAPLLPGRGAAGDGDEDGACLALLEELRKRMVAEEEEAAAGPPAAPWLGGDAGTAALAPFLAWLGDECAALRAAKAAALARSRGLQREVEAALRGKLHYEVVSAAAVQRSLAAWEKLAAALERALGRADHTHAQALRGSRALLETLRREGAWAGTEPAPSLVTDMGPSQSPVTNAGPSQRPVTNMEPSQSPVTNVGSSQSAVTNTEPSQSPVTNTEPSQSPVTNMGPSQSPVTNMGPSQSLATNTGPPRSPVTNREGVNVEQELQELRESNGVLLGELLLERLSVTVAALRGRERHGDNGGAEQRRAVEVARAQEEVTAVEVTREEVTVTVAKRELELQEKVSGLERSLGTLRARAGQLASACRDKDTTMKKLLVETEKLSAEVLGLRGQNARLQLQLEVQEKNHQDIVAVYRTHLLHAAQGFMDEGVHAMLLRILRTGEWGAGSDPLPSLPPSH
ncbi:hypothetical protein Q9233_012641 [Columba guinea]|nr:hypothetical protein Q9233_012641 [Columba guinea]